MDYVFFRSLFTNHCADLKNNLQHILAVFQRVRGQLACLHNTFASAHNRMVASQNMA
jgi:hypothetical protein